MRRIIISGYFCTGKTSILKHLAKEFGLHKPKVYTTRLMRANEKEGDPYTFISEEIFHLLKKSNKLFDPMQHADNYYAVDLEDMYEKEIWVIDILPDSWDIFKKIPGVVGIYLIPPNPKILKERALERGDSEESIAMRLKAMKEQNPDDYDYAIEPQTSLKELWNRVKAIINSL